MLKAACLLLDNVGRKFQYVREQSRGQTVGTDNAAGLPAPARCQLDPVVSLDDEAFLNQAFQLGWRSLGAGPPQELRSGAPAFLFEHPGLLKQFLPRIVARPAHLSLVPSLLAGSRHRLKSCTSRERPGSGNS